MTLDDGRAVIPLWPDCGRDVLHLSKDVVYRAAAGGELPFVERVGGRWLVLVPRLREWLGERSEKPQTAADGHVEATAEIAEAAKRALAAQVLAALGLDNANGSGTASSQSASGNGRGPEP